MASATTITIVKLETLEPSSTSISKITLDDIGLPPEGGGGGGSPQVNPIWQTILEGNPFSLAIGGLQEWYLEWIKQFYGKSQEEIEELKKRSQNLRKLAVGGLGAGGLLAGIVLLSKLRKKKKENEE